MRPVKNTQGQTTIEYLLLLLVVVVLIQSFAPAVRSFILADCDENPNSTVCQFERILDGDGNYRSFPLF